MDNFQVRIHSAAVNLLIPIGSASINFDHQASFRYTQSKWLTVAIQGPAHMIAR